MLRLKALWTLVERSIDEREEYQAALSELKETLPTLEELLKSHHIVLMMEHWAPLKGLTERGADMVTALYGLVLDQLLEVREHVRMLERLERLKSRTKELGPSQAGYPEAEKDLAEIERQIKERHGGLLGFSRKGVRSSPSCLWKLPAVRRQ